jgi:hypothetical protein
VKITETCSCGAKIEAETQDERLVQRVVDRWRRKHNHVKTYEWPTRWVDKHIPYQPVVTWNTGGQVAQSGSTSATTRKTTKDEDW